MTDRADVTLIGAGVIGLAIAARVAGRNRSLYELCERYDIDCKKSGKLIVAAFHLTY